MDSDAAVVEAAQWLHAQGVQQVVLSLGQRGAYWSQHLGARGWQAAFPVPVANANATGAGDALLAGLVHGYLQASPLAEAAGFGAACAALTLTAPGANHPGLAVEAVRQMLQRHPPPAPDNARSHRDPAEVPGRVAPPTESTR